MKNKKDLYFKQGITYLVLFVLLFVFLYEVPVPFGPFHIILVILYAVAASKFIMVPLQKNESGVLELNDAKTILAMILALIGIFLAFYFVGPGLKDYFSYLFSFFK